jgi:glycosyltransferase involved in cell wall biosynthesis
VLINALALHSAHDAARVFLENLIRRLPGAWPEADVTVVLPQGTPLPEGVSGVTTETIRSTRLRLPGVIRRIRPDVVINPNESVPPRLDAALVVVSQNLLFHCPAVGPLDSGPWRARLRSRLQFAFYRHQMPKAYKRADAVVPVSDHAARELAQHAGLEPSRVRVVHYGADRLSLKPRRPEAGPRRLLIVGAIAHYKRLTRAVEALSVLRTRGGDYELHLAGEAWPGYEEVLRSAASRADVANQVRFLGPLGSDELADAFAGCHVGLALSECESFGIPVVEGMRAGLPHVVADEPWSAETVGDAAVRVDASQPEAIAAGVQQLEDPDEWTRRSEEARRAVQRYTWEANAIGIARVAAGVAARRVDRRDEVGVSQQGGEAAMR